MKKIVYFGETVEGYSIPVLNEREIRAAAGIFFFFLFISLMEILYRGNFIMIKVMITVFLTDFLIRVFINPKYAPSLILARFIVRNQTPEYVGAQQKKIAWIIGVVLAVIMFIMFNIVNAYSIITGLICLVCLIFLSFESAFGICLGCKFYNWFYKEKAQHCPGEVCDVKSRHAIQKTSWGQFFILLGFAAYIVVVVNLLHDHFAVKPHDLFGKQTTEVAKH